MSQTYKIYTLQKQHNKSKIIFTVEIFYIHLKKYYLTTFLFPGINLSSNVSVSRLELAALRCNLKGNNVKCNMCYFLFMENLKCYTAHRNSVKMQSPNCRKIWKCFTIHHVSSFIQYDCFSMLLSSSKLIRLDNNKTYRCLKWCKKRA